MRLRLSSFVSLLPVGANRILVIHAVSQARLVVDSKIGQLLGQFATPQQTPPGVTPSPTIMGLVERGVLVDLDAGDEVADVLRELGEQYGRDPAELLDRLRRRGKESVDPYWAVGPALGVEELAGGRRRMDLLLIGECDVHMEGAFLRREAARWGIDLRVAATLFNDLQLAADHAHDAVVIGGLLARRAIGDEFARDRVGRPFDLYLEHARGTIGRLREFTAAPILIDNLPEPTLQPLGMAERSADGHRNRFRQANIELADLVEDYPDVHVIDVAAALAAAGSERMIDDHYFSFTHFGSPGWLLQRPQSELAAVYGLFPDLAPVAERVDGDPYGREAVMAKAHVEALVTVTGLDRKKCVIVDLDGVLWPGVLAETGAPFAWTPESGPPFSFVGLYFGIHQALVTLKRRGVLLACVSKNDEAVVRALWAYGEHYPTEALLTPGDFVTWRVNWEDKAGNIASIADELGFALSACLFVDDSPLERERVRGALPEVEVWGEDLFALRRRLLTDPRLQTSRLTAASAERTQTTKAQLGRRREQSAAPDLAAFIASLDVQTVMARLTSAQSLDRVAELFDRTTQFNATGARFTAAELEAFVRRPDAGVFTLQVSDRFGDHGLAGAAVVRDGEILGLAISCRVLGLGVEHGFLQFVMQQSGPDLRGRIVPTERNGPVRNIYRDNGFQPNGEGVWRLGAVSSTAEAGSGSRSPA